jgi:hypothetical protein
MSPLGGSPTLSPVDRRALVVGRLCATVSVAGIIGVIALELLIAEGVVWERHWLWLAMFGLVIGAWTAAWLTMLWHQARSGLPMQDADDWDRRAGASRFGFLVPFTYLLGPPDQRRVTRYARRTKRRRWH